MSISRLQQIVAALIVALQATALAGSQGGLRESLSKAKSVRCVFSVMASVEWDKDEPRGEIKPSRLTIAFDAIDSDEGTARVIGQFGPSDIIVRSSSESLHFVQAFSGGPLYATTIFPYAARDGHLRAVHTRHEYTHVSLPGFTSRPEQYYGQCELGQ